ncbi:hypothetical protein P9112_002940 [Eukaryota sp. TZLM1-RC]
MYVLKSSALPVLGGLLSFSGISAALAISYFNNDLVWETSSYVYISEFAGRFPADVPFIWTINLAAALFFVSLHFLCTKIRTKGGRQCSRFLRFMSFLSALVLSLVSIVSTYDSDKMHSILTLTFFACVFFASLFMVQGSWIIRNSNPKHYKLSICLFKSGLLVLLSLTLLSLLYFTWYVGTALEVYLMYSVFSEYVAVVILILLFTMMGYDLHNDVIHFYNELPATF